VNRKSREIFETTLIDLLPLREKKRFHAALASLAQT